MPFLEAAESPRLVVFFPGVNEQLPVTKPVGWIRAMWGRLHRTTAVDKLSFMHALLRSWVRYRFQIKEMVNPAWKGVSISEREGLNVWAFM